MQPEMILATDQNITMSHLSKTSKAVLALREQVFDVWEARVRNEVEGAYTVLTPVLIDTLPAFYGNLVEALSADYPRTDATSNNTAAAAHGGERARMTNYGPEQVIHEYHLFRDVLQATTRLEGVVLLAEHWDIIDRSINLAVRAAIREYTSVSEELRHKLAAALSHDMRTPLGVISNGAQLIDIAPDLAYAQRVAKKIETNANRLASMIGEVLDALTTQRGRQLPLDVTQFDMADLVNSVKEDFEDRVLPTIEVTAPSIIGYWCYDTLRRAIENLVSNAANYGDGTIVRIQIVETRGRLFASVHNTGNSLPLAQLDRIFEYGERGQRPMGQGWGIGLPFVKKAAEEHGGSVAVDSAPATGTTFLIDVPVDTRPFTSGSAPPR